MKKTVLLSTLTLSAAIAAMGQSHHVRAKFPTAYERSNRVAAKTTTGDAARCIAIAATEHLGVLSFVVDTESYAYSGARGGSVLTGDMKYDHGITFQFGGSSLDSNAYYVQTFDSHDNILTHTEQQYDAPSASFVNSYQVAYTYDASNNKLTEISQNWDVPTSAWVNTVKSTYTYNSLNNVTSQLHQTWVSGAWVNSSFDTFTYNSSNKQILDLSSTWNGGTSSWDISAKDTLTYDASNNLATDTYLSWSTGTGWTTEYTTAYSNYAGPGLYQAAVSQMWDGTAMVNDTKDSITYSTYNQPVYYFQKNWSTTTGSWNQDTFVSVHFYYELYSNSVTQVNNAATVLDVYPNPASGIINIRVDVAGGKNTTITLQDVTGRVVRTIDGSNFKEGVNTIQCATGELAAGTYFLHMANDKANVTRKVVVSK